MISAYRIFLLVLPILIIAYLAGNVRDLIVDTLEEMWKDEVRNKLAEVFKDNAEDFAKILFFLDEEDRAYKDSDRPYAPQWKSLKATVKMDKAFREFAKLLSDKIKISEKDEQFRERMKTVFEQTLSHCDDTFSIEKYQKHDPNRINYDQSSTFALNGLERTLSIIPAESKISLINSIRAIVIKYNIIPLDNVVILGDDARINIMRWWKGEISGKRCIKNVLDKSLPVLASMAGGTAGAYIGLAIAGPLGGLLGGPVGAWLSGAGMRYVCDWLTQKLFGLPKEEALENAHRYLGVDLTASNAEVNTAFRKLALKHHPDRGGNQDDFLILQINMAVIKQARPDS